MGYQKNKRNEQEYFSKIRAQVNHGDNASQEQLNQICDMLYKDKDTLRPNEVNEVFELVDSHGKPNNLIAPRWACHFLGLRHRAVHIVIKWSSPTLNDIFILQIRSWTKLNSPGHIDISAAGHFTGSGTSISINNAYKELKEELGLTKIDLVNDLVHYGGYECYNEREEDNFYNAEWREIYIGEITLNGFNKIQFNDNEVVSLYLCPISEAKALLSQNIIPIASALKHTLPRCL